MIAVATGIYKVSFLSCTWRRDATASLDSMTIILAVLNARVAKQKTIIVFMEEEIALVILTRPRLRAMVTTDGSGGRLEAVPQPRQQGAPPTDRRGAPRCRRRKQSVQD